MKAQLIDPREITVLKVIERTETKSDASLKESIREHGIEQALICVRDGDRLLLAKGLRRLRIAKELGIEVPVITVAPKGDPRAFVRSVRLGLSFHRQDLKPSQICEMLLELKSRFGLSNIVLARARGVSDDTITNWLGIKDLIFPVVAALDAGLITLTAARTFVGMTTEAQELIWEQHREEIVANVGGKIHQELRDIYSAKECPEFYRNAELAKVQKSRVKRVRPSREREDALLSSLETKETLVREGVKEERRMRDLINAAVVPIHAIMRDDELPALIARKYPDMISDFERFIEAY